jgi:hypothetical protein
MGGRIVEKGWKVEMAAPMPSHTLRVDLEQAMPPEGRPGLWVVNSQPVTEAGTVPALHDTPPGVSQGAAQGPCRGEFAESKRPQEVREYCRRKIYEGIRIGFLTHISGLLGSPTSPRSRPLPNVTTKP